MTDAHEEGLRLINVALSKIKEAHYQEAMDILEQAKQLSPNTYAEQLQQLIYKYLKNAETKSSTTPPSPAANEEKPLPHSEPQTSTPYTAEQLALVDKILNCYDYYEILGVGGDATQQEIKKAYKRLALQLHPDKNYAPGAADAFKSVGKAATVLSDDLSRQYYDIDMLNIKNRMQNAEDRHYAQWQQQQRAHDEPDFDTTFAEEFLNTFFNSRYSPYRNAANQRQPQQMIDRHPSLALGVLVVLVIVSLALSFVSTDADYSLAQTSKYPIRRETLHLSIPYYVKKSFESDFTGSMGRLEISVEQDYIYTMKQTCFRERSFPEIDELIEKLKLNALTSEDNSQPNTTPSSNSDTTALLTEISATKDPKLFDKHELAEFFLKLTQSSDNSVRKEAAKCIAEITKSEIQRKKFTKHDIIKVFIDCLQDIKPNKDNDSDMELPIQICRALGNICYLNDEARDLILELKGDEVLIQLLDITELPETENSQQFVKVRGGLLSNYLLGGEGLAKRAMELQIMQKLQNIISLGLSNVELYEDLLLNTLPLLSILTENVADLNFEANLNIQLSHILAASTNPDLAEMCLELLHYQAESDDVKLLLAKDGLCETIYNLLEKYKTLASTNEARALMKLACELIVLILTGDDSMHFLYSTALLKNMEDWLDSDDIDLLTTGVLALGNFARTDSHCIYMVEQKIMNKLLDVLAKNNGVKDDVRLQHALLSALRNLVIPKPNKGAVIQAGLVETILPMLEIHQPPVVFKLLGTLRMTVDGQEKLALDLLKNTTLIEQLVHWSKSSDYAGVTGESLRLMAWLIKHAYLSKIAYALPRKGDAPLEQLADKMPTQDNYDLSSLSTFLTNEGTIEAMINMLVSQHLVMQNEALIALCILSVVYLVKARSKDATELPPESQKLEDAFIKFEVGKKLAELIQRSSDTMTKEIVENLQNFINLLRTSEKLSEHLEKENINELLKAIPILTEYCTL